MKSANDWYVWFESNRDCRITADGITAIQDDATTTTPDLMTAWKTVADQLRDWEEFARLARRAVHASENKIRFGQLERNIADARSMLRPCVFDFEDMVNMMEGDTK